MKHFLYQEEQGLGGGFYTWDTREAADTFIQNVARPMEERMGSRPSYNTSRRRLWWTTTPARFG